MLRSSPRRRGSSALLKSACPRRSAARRKSRLRDLRHVIMCSKSDISDLLCGALQTRDRPNLRLIRGTNRGGLTLILCGRASQSTHPGGSGTPPGGQYGLPARSMADGGSRTVCEIPRKARPMPEGERRDGAPGGAARSREGARHKEQWLRHLARHPLALPRPRKRDLVSAAVKNTSDAVRPHLYPICNIARTFNHTRRSSQLAPRFGHTIQSDRGPR